MKALLVQLSDIHIKGPDEAVLSRSRALAAAICEHGTLVDLVLCIVSGDIAYSGKDVEYSLARDFFYNLKRTLNSQLKCPIHFVFCPGNHDCNFDDYDVSLRNTSIDGILSNPPEYVTQKLAECCTSVQAPFFSFRDGLETVAYA